MHWCGIKFSRAESGLWMPDHYSFDLKGFLKAEVEQAIRNYTHNFVGLREMALEAPDPDATHDPELEELVSRTRKDMSKAGPGDGEITDSTLKDFL